MEVYPLKSISLDDAKAMQFRLVDAICSVFSGAELLTQGDLGLFPGLNQPQTTRKVEQVLSRFFNTEDAILVWGTGTGALRCALSAVLRPGDNLLVHEAPVYPTTQVSLDELGLSTVAANFNTLNSAAGLPAASAALVQITRQKPDDSYDAHRVIPLLKEAGLPVITDDNYSVMKTEKCGVELGADLSAFSLFKLLGPEGVGCVIGKSAYIDAIRKKHYSGGSQIQGHTALNALRMMVYAPVALAIQAEVGQQLVSRLTGGEVAGVKDAFLCNAQSKVVLIELEQHNAAEVIQQAHKLGALPYPVGSESIYEISPLFYRVSGTFLKSDPELAKKMIRVNPMRSGADTVIRILREAMTLAKP